MRLANKISNFLGYSPIQFLCRLLLGGLFIYASMDKIAHPLDFAKIIYNYQLLPDFCIHWVAVGLPWFEMICGLSLVSGVLVRTPAILLSVILFLFIIGLTINSFRGLDISCGCFSTSAETTDNLLPYILRDIGFLLLGLLILFFNKNRNRKKK